MRRQSTNNNQPTTNQWLNLNLCAESVCVQCVCVRVQKERLLLCVLSVCVCVWVI